MTISCVDGSCLDGSVAQIQPQYYFLAWWWAVVAVVVALGGLGIGLWIATLVDRRRREEESDR